ncbi:MAG TPA: TAXI family TRAP transporter solute-binding subunit [Terriglobales bacterium]|nr:TAXI family TRAP transporter solute-binding subunit [Terriglobales bacterium]
MRSCLRAGLFSAFIAAAFLGEQVWESRAQTPPSLSPGETAKASPRKESTLRKEAGTSENRYTAGFVTGAPYSTEFAIAQEIATAVSSSQESGPHGEVALRVMPMVGNGGISNVTDVLTLANADMAVAPVLLADRLRDEKTFGDVRDKLVYITPLYVEEFHLLARSEIKNVTDLAGKKVNLGEQGSAGAVLGREVLKSLDVNIDESNLGLEAALDGMRKRQIFATLLVSGKPVNFLARYPQAEGFHLLPIPFSRPLQYDYLPSSLHHDDYPNIVAPGESVDTIGIKSALFAYNWAARSERFRLLEFFVQTLFSRVPEFLGESHHPKWREVNLAATLPGWKRFRPAEQWLQQSSGQRALRESFSRFLEHNSSGDLANRDQLFQEFLRWRDRQRGR